MTLTYREAGPWGAGKVHVIFNWINNTENTPVLEKFAAAYAEREGQDFTSIGHWNSLHMLREAMRKARSIDPAKVALALEGMHYASPMGKVEMRAHDHQLQAPIYLGTWGKKGSPGIKYESERSGYGFRAAAVWSATDAAMPSTCKMERP